MAKINENIVQRLRTKSKELETFILHKNESISNFMFRIFTEFNMEISAQFLLRERTSKVLLHKIKQNSEGE